MAEWKGLDKALARMARLPAEVKASVEKQLDLEAEQLAQAIRDATPVKTGALRESIRVVPGNRPLSRRIVMGGATTTVKVRTRKLDQGRGKRVGVSDASFAKALKTGGNHGEFDYSRAVEFGYLTPEGVEVRGLAMFFGTYRARRKAIRRRMSAAARKPLKTLFPE